MKFKNLFAENIYSFQNLEVDFTAYAGGTTVILGKNLDQKTSNGSGKSSILKILYWVLWGKDVRGAKLEDLTHRLFANAGMIARLTFEDRGNEYQITRYKDYKKKKLTLHDGSLVSGSGLEFLINGEPMMGSSPVQTQKIIEQKLRMSPRLFLSSVYMAQRSKTNFLTANDTEKKEILSELLDLMAYEKAFKDVKEAITELEDKMSLLEGRMENWNEQISTYEQQVAKLTEDEAHYATEVANEKSATQIRIDQIKAEIQTLSVTATLPDRSLQLKKTLTGVLDKIQELKEQLAVEPEARKVLTELDTELKLIRERLVELNTERADKTRELDRLREQITPLSGGPFEENFLTLALAQQQDLRSQVQSLQKKLQAEAQLRSQLSNYEHTIQRNQEQLNQIAHQTQEAKDNNLCPTCRRAFALEDNATLDEILKKLQRERQILEEANLSQQALAKELNQELLGFEEIRRELIQIEAKLATVEAEVIELQNQKQAADLHRQRQELLTTQIVASETQLTNLVNEIGKQEKSQQSKTNKHGQVQQLLSELEPIKNQLQQLETESSAATAELAAAEIEAVKIQQAQQQVANARAELLRSTTHLQNLTTKVNPYGAMKAKSLEQIKSLQTKLDTTKTEIASLTEEISYLRFWKIGFAPTGIRSFITDDVIDLLNKKTQENLNDLFDGAISVVFEPESKDSKGVSSNKISTTFLANGKPTVLELLSGGEEQRAILATELALTEVAEVRAGTKLNLRFLDEPFENIDGGGQVKSLGLFARLARDKDGFFIITHQEDFQNLCPKALYVVKKGEISKTVDKTTFKNTAIDDADTSAGFAEGENLHLAPPPKKSFAEALKKKKQQEEDDN